MNRKKLVVSFSGGETSAFMTWWVLHSEYVAKTYCEIKIIFANTGQENEATLEFVKNCDQYFKFKTVWVEAVTHHNLRMAPTSKVVSFKTADRVGKVFEDTIKKYGVPGPKFKHCSRVLKMSPIQHYVEHTLGWPRKSYDLAIGIRADEMDRISTNRHLRCIVYPFIQWVKITKPNVNDWWRQQSFRLELKGYQGNCKWCWKKSLRKHFTIISETPKVYDFPERMEKLYGLVGPEFSQKKVQERGPVPVGYRRHFFRGNVSTEMLKALYQQNRDNFKKFDDDSVVYKDFVLDLGGGCEESCEVFSDEDAEPLE